MRDTQDHDTPRHREYRDLQQRERRHTDALVGKGNREKGSLSTEGAEGAALHRLLLDKPEARRGLTDFSHREEQEPDAQP
jgi:hypothetical protein